MENIKNFGQFNESLGQKELSKIKNGDKIIYRGKDKKGFIKGNLVDKVLNEQWQKDWKDMEFVKDAKIITDEFYYDLFDGGYIKPEELLKNKEDIDNVKKAIEIIKDFRESAEDNGILEYR